MVHVMVVLCKYLSSFISILSLLLTRRYFKVYDSPEEHPRIHPEEKKYILQALGSTVTQNNEKKADVPWKAILTSKVVLINVIGHWGSAFGFLTLATQTPSYFSSVFGWGNETLGSVSGLPHLLLVTFSISFSSFADYLLSSGRMSRNNVRRLASFICKNQNLPKGNSLNYDFRYDFERILDTWRSLFRLQLLLRCRFSVTCFVL